MRLVLMRHGIAIDREDPACPPDPERALTEKGRERTHSAALGLVELEVHPTRVFSSPYVRARETAEIVADVMRMPRAAIELVDDLLPDEAGKAFAARAESFADGEVVLATGHAPNLDDVIAALLGSRRPVTELKKAGCALIERSGGVTVLRWLHEPWTLRKISR